MKAFDKMVWRALDVLGWRELFDLRWDALRTYGWERSAKERASIGANGEPIPWITYPAIDLLAARVRPHFRVFEFGCGNSTLWWAKTVTSVRSVEHDRAWHEKISRLTPGNVTLEWLELERGGDYCRRASLHGPYEIIVVDGRDRVNCMRHSAGSLTDDGVMVLDNSDREEYAEGVQFLTGSGFRQLPLRGLAPSITYVSETSIFYRPGNVLAL